MSPKRETTSEIQARDVALALGETLWLARIDDLDCGPFAGAEVRQRIRAKQIDLQTLLCEERERLWKPMGEWPEFRQFFERMEEIRQEDEVHDALDKQEAQVRRGRKVIGSLGYAGIGVAFLAAGIVALVLATQEQVLPSNYTGSIFMTADLPRIERWEQFSGEQAHEWRFGKEPTKRTVRRAGGGRGGRAGRGAEHLVFDDSDEPVALDFGDDSDGARTLSDQELNAEVLPRVQSAVSSCLRAESTGRPDFSGATIQFAVLPTGQTAAVRVLDAVTPALHACVKAKVRPISVAPFSGGTRWMKVTLRFTAQ